MKTNEDRIQKIFTLGKEHFGGVKHVSVKLTNHEHWVANIAFESGSSVDNIMEVGIDATEALRNLKKRMMKIKTRYGVV